MIRLFKKIELWTCEGSWCRPDEWVFSIDHSCISGCIIISMGFVELTILRGGCSFDLDYPTDKET
jgi:hypothetical protein